MYKTTVSHRESQRKYRWSHLEEQQTATRLWRASGGNRHNSARKEQLKIEVLSYYGNDRCACVACGESRLACLSIDHINGNGCKERTAGGYLYYGYSFYNLLKKGGYPDGYQTLCMNCQFCKVVLDNSHRKRMEK